MLTVLRRAAAHAVERVAGVRRERGDAGISLVELLVTAGLMSIVGALSLTVLVSTTDTSDKTADAGVTTAGARSVLTSWTTLLQVAVPPAAGSDPRGLSVTPTSLAFNAQLANKAACGNSGCPTGASTRAELSLRTITDSGKGVTQLVQTLTGSTGSGTTVVLVPRGAGVPQVSGTDACLFTPYTAAGVRLGCDSLSSAVLATVARVDIAFTVASRAGAVQSFRTSVLLPGNFA